MKRAPIKNKPTIADEMAARKLADRYVARDGQPASIVDRARAGRHQDLNDDDRKHLRYCVDRLRRAAVMEEDQACLDFIEAVLDIHYGVLAPEERPQDESNRVNWREDPDLYNYAMGRR